MKTFEKRLKLSRNNWKFEAKASNRGTFENIPKYLAISIIYLKKKKKNENGTQKMRRYENFIAKAVKKFKNKM